MFNIPHLKQEPSIQQAYYYYIYTRKRNSFCLKIKSSWQDSQITHSRALPKGFVFVLTLSRLN